MVRYGIAMVALAAASGVFLYLMRLILIGTSRGSSTSSEATSSATCRRSPSRSSTLRGPVT